MSEMVERVARAIAKSHKVGNLFIAPDGSPHETEPVLDFIEHARAAIEAMREPTYNMIICATNLPIMIGDSLPARTWQAMIDEALAP